MFYVDTSVIVKLYIKEAFSLEVSNWVKARNETIPLTAFHELEFKNALYLKQFRSEITDAEIRTILLKFSDHQKRGVYYRPAVNWSDTLIKAIDIACTHTKKTGARSLDVIHVAAALSIKAGSFLTLDDRQANLAALTGLKLEDCTEPPETLHH